MVANTENPLPELSNAYRPFKGDSQEYTSKKRNDPGWLVRVSGMDSPIEPNA
jgi:hypothetical protein